VALGGDGGDELFGGYFHHSRILRLHQQRRFVPRPIRRLLGRGAEHLLPVGMKGRNFLLALMEELPGSIARCNTYFDGLARRRLLSSVFESAPRSKATTEYYKNQLAETRTSPLQKATAVDFLTYLVDDILVKVDRASMLASLEVRAPWLDQHLVEFAFSRVPDDLKTTVRQRKILPRRLAQRLLPPQLDLRRKHGFSLPLATWFRGAWGSYFEEVLSEVDPNVFNRKTIRSLLDGQRRGYSNIQRLFALTIFELWRRHYGVTV
jgi:asparagine synthase (glutamine-hydrolysing)